MYEDVGMAVTEKLLKQERDGAVTTHICYCHPYILKHCTENHSMHYEFMAKVN